MCEAASQLDGPPRETAKQSNNPVQICEAASQLDGPKGETAKRSNNPQLKNTERLGNI